MKPFMNEQTPAIVKINVTPIIDVAMVLVITLLITAPMIARSDIDVNLPETQTRSIEDEVRISVTLGPDGRTAVDDKNVARADLAQALHARIAGAKSDNVLVVVRADAGLDYGDVRSLVQEVRSVGARRIAFATRLRGKELE